MAKILVLGDSSTGKSSLISLICHSKVLTSSYWTIGCFIDVKLHDDCFLEFWEIGGSRNHKIARSFLYQEYHGIILVFDSTNKKSRSNLNEWLMEITERSNDINVPVITIATKKDLMPYGGNRSPEVNSEVIYVNTQDVLSFSFGSKNCDRLNDFFKQVIDRRNKKFYNKFAI